MLQLSQKEKMLLQDQKNHEQLCIEKYSKYANEAQDPQLKQLFTSLGSIEQEHLNTINQILSGQVPNLQQGQQSQQQNQQPQFSANQAGSTTNKNDASLANDMLSTEKYISGTYDTVIFETANSGVRQALNHIQKEEQQHGESLFNYMQSKGMYQVQ